MSLGIAFWICMLVWFILGVPWPGVPWPAWPGHILLFVLFLLIGWRVFGAPLHG